MSPPVNQELCRFLEWDSRFFELKIGRINSAQLQRPQMSEIRDWCRSRNIDCLYFLADAGHSETAQVAAENGFVFVDLRVTLDRELTQPPGNGRPNPSIRLFQPADFPALRQLAGRPHEDTRFFSDPHFPRERSRELYSVWFEKSCRNPRGQVFVAFSESQPVGYLACSLGEGGQGQIELTGVDPSARGRGLGNALLAAALDWLGEREVRRISVVTQGRNVRGQRLYQKSGFLTYSFELWFHFWPKLNPAKRE